jgi:hypothetical protein
MTPFLLSPFQSIVRLSRLLGAAADIYVLFNKLWYILVKPDFFIYIYNICPAEEWNGLPVIV